MNQPDFSFLVEYQGMSLTMIVSSLFIGVVIASIAMLYHQLFLGGIVRRIIKKEAFSEEKALTIEEMGYNPKNPLVRFALRKDSTFTKTVKRIDTPIPKFYIPEEIRMRAEIRFRKEGNTVFGILITILVFLVVAYASLTIIPIFSDAIKQIFS